MVTLQAKKALFEKHKLMNYKASMRLEGINLTGATISATSDHGVARERVLKKYKSIK